MCNSELHYFDVIIFTNDKRLMVETDKLIVGEKSLSYNYLFYAMRKCLCWNC